jgi:hypothetical protein
LTNPARHRVDVPAELHASLLEFLVASRGIVVLLIDPEALADGVEAFGVSLGRERGDALSGPFLAHVLGSAERGRVVDDRAATEARTGDQADALVVRRGGSSHVEAGERPVLAAVEVLVVIVVARFEHDHVETCPSQHASGGAATGARADDHDVAAQLAVAQHRGQGQRLRRRAHQLPKWAVVADRVPGGIATAVAPGDDVVEEQRGLAQRLEDRPALRQAGVGPGPKHALALLARHRAEAAPAARAERTEQRRVPQREQAGELLLLGLATRVDGGEYRLGNSELAGSRKPIPVGAERLADLLERLALTGRELHSPTLFEPVFPRRHDHGSPSDEDSLDPLG